jgi:hypothetical protein
MSRRKRRQAGAPGTAGGAERGGQTATGRGSGAPDAGRATRRGLAVDVGVLIAVFAVTAGIAELAGAANLGVALGVGQVAFGIALVVVLLRG